MADWVMTATTIYCEAVEEEVTLMINKDGTARCTGQAKFADAAGETARQIKARERQHGRPLACEGLDCSHITEYKQKLLAEDGGKG